MNKTYSILRAEQDKEIAKLTLSGSVLDVGGDTRSEYQKSLSRTCTVHSINISEDYLPHEIVDIEETFPYADCIYDAVICFNVLEHIVETQHVFKEMIRVTKTGGQIVMTTPFLYYIHGSPDDYQRYTDSFYRKMAEKYACTVVQVTPLGSGFFSVGFNFIGGVLPTLILKRLCMKIAVALDSLLSKVSKKYKKLSERLPMGYFVVFVKK